MKQEGQGLAWLEWIKVYGKWILLAIGIFFVLGMLIVIAINVKQSQATEAAAKAVRDKEKEITPIVITAPDTTLIRLDRELDSLKQIENNARASQQDVIDIITTPPDQLLRDLTEWNRKHYPSPKQ